MGRDDQSRKSHGRSAARPRPDGSGRSSRSARGLILLPLAACPVRPRRERAWIGNLTRLAPYQPFFIAVTIACLGYGYWLVYRSSKVACAGGEACARPLSNRLVQLGLIVATVLVVAAIGFNFLAPLLLDL